MRLSSPGLSALFFLEPFKILSGSSYPTLEIGDFLFVSNILTAIRAILFLSAAPRLRDGWEDLPERGDVVVFKYPGDNKTDFIKRVIGLPGIRYR